MPIYESEKIKVLQSILGEDEAQAMFLKVLRLPYLLQLIYFAGIQSSRELATLSSALHAPLSLLQDLFERSRIFLAEQSESGDLSFVQAETLQACVNNLSKQIISLYDRGLEFQPLLFHLLYSGFKLDYFPNDSGVSETVNHVMGEAELNNTTVWRMHDEIIYNTLRQPLQTRQIKQDIWQKFVDLCQDISLPVENYEILQSLAAKILT